MAHILKVVGRGVAEAVTLVAAIQVGSEAGVFVWKQIDNVDEEQLLGDYSRKVFAQKDSLLNEQVYVITSFGNKFLKMFTSAVRSASRMEDEQPTNNNGGAPQQLIQRADMLEFWGNLMDTDAMSQEERQRAHESDNGIIVIPADNSTEMDAMLKEYASGIEDKYRALPPGYVDLPNLVTIPNSQLFTKNFVCASLTSSLLLFQRLEETKSYFNSIEFFLNRFSRAKVIETVGSTNLLNADIAQLAGA
jgi:hypothetical protein